jgi:hypothetical protein
VLAGFFYGIQQRQAGASPGAFPREAATGEEDTPPGRRRLDLRARCRMLSRVVMMMRLALSTISAPASAGASSSRGRKAVAMLVLLR